MHTHRHADSLIESLRRLATEYRHIQNEHLREERGHPTRRRLEIGMRAVARRFERSLAHWVTDQELRGAWLRHMYEDAPPPDGPLLAVPPIFEGVTDAGSVLEVRPAPGDGCYDIVMDGARERHESVPWDLDPEIVSPVLLGGHPCRERFSVPADAAQALAALVGRPDREPPWSWATALYEDGLVDLDFSLTPRGRRFLRTLSVASARRRQRFGVLVADAARARILTLETTLVEVASLTHRERRARDSELFSDPRPGLRREGPNGPRHGTDDHRGRERRDADRHFADLVAAETMRVAQAFDVSELVVVAGPAMLGFLRPAFARRKDERPLHELARDLTRLAPPPLHDALAHAGLLPPRERPSPPVRVVPGQPV